MTLKPALFCALLLMLGACAAPPAERSGPRGFAAPVCPAPRAAAPEPPAPALVRLSELARIAALSPEQRRRELAELENSRRPEEARRFQLAALLEREDGIDALERSLKLLGAMDETDPRTQTLIEMMKKSLKARIEFRQQAARTQEAQDKLEQIKALEKSLQQRSAPPKAP